MIEAKTFELEKTEKRFPMPVIIKGIKKGQSLLIGNPTENQYLSLRLISYGIQSVVLNAREINGDQEYVFGNQTISLWTRYTISGTNFSIESHRNHARSGISLILSKFENIDVFQDDTRKL